jgi:hypothetical protein
MKNMQIFAQLRRILTAFVLIFVLTTTAACSGAVQAKQPLDRPVALNYGQEYARLERGDTPAGQNFGTWVTQTGKGLIKDAYVRDNNKLGVVIMPQVRPNEVRSLAKSLAQGFHRNFPNQDLTVLMYAPDKQLILTAEYDKQTNRIEYKS